MSDQAAQWERAKGELRASVALSDEGYGGLTPLEERELRAQGKNTRWSFFNKAAEAFIKWVEGWELHLGSGHFVDPPDQLILPPPPKDGEG